ncbi:DUF6440 family protein [Faecalibaculum rodentium]|uniref:DUF6440 family protein n=1 Tax=Faecalibaculum rodentium TaxID=1702221 RepID=UPI0023F30E8E|nr:DUF6440 family protein [Faecalibaculum rodentium]
MAKDTRFKPIYDRDGLFRAIQMYVNKGNDMNYLFIQEASCGGVALLPDPECRPVVTTVNKSGGSWR